MPLTIDSVVYRGSDHTIVVNATPAIDGDTMHYSFVDPADDSELWFADSTSGLADDASLAGGDFTYDGTYKFIVTEASQPAASVVFDFNTTTHIVSNVVITNGVISMAGTGQGRLFSARCRMQEPNGRKFTLEGNGLDAAGAIGELEAKLALIDARVTVISAVRLTGNLSSGQITAFNTVDSARTSDAGGYDDVDITLRQVFNAGTATQVIETPVVRIQDAVNGIASASIDGTVDVTNTLVAALAAAYVDPDGNTGYAAYHGRFARS